MDLVYHTANAVAKEYYLRFQGIKEFFKGVKLLAGGSFCAYLLILHRVISLQNGKEVFDKEKHKNLERSQTSLGTWGLRSDRAVSSLSFLLPLVNQVSPGEARNLEMPTDVDKKGHEKSSLCSQRSRKRTA